MSKSEKQRKLEAEARFVKDQLEEFQRNNITQDVRKTITSALMEKMRNLESQAAEEDEAPQIEQKAPEAQTEAPEMVPDQQEQPSQSQDEFSFDEVAKITESVGMSAPQDAPQAPQSQPTPEPTPDPPKPQMAQEASERPSEPPPTSQGQMYMEASSAGPQPQKETPGSRAREEAAERKRQWVQRGGLSIVQGEMLDRWKESIKKNQFKDDSRGFGSTLPNFRPGSDPSSSQNTQLDLATAADNASSSLLQTISTLAQIAVNFSDRLREIERTLEEASV